MWAVKVFWVANKMLWPCINQCLTVTLNTSPILCRAGEERLSGCHWRAEKTQLGVKSVKTKTKQKLGCGKKRQKIIVVMSKRRLYAGEWLIRAPAILSLPLSYIQIFLDAAMQIGIFIGCILSNRSLLTFREGTFFSFYICLEHQHFVGIIRMHDWICASSTKWGFGLWGEFGYVVLL